MNASPRWAALAATITLGSVSGTRPVRWTSATAHKPWRAASSSPIARSFCVRHLDVGLVVERLDVARDPLEADDGAGPRIAHDRGHRRQVERLIGDLDQPHRIGGAAAHGRDQRDLVAGEHGLVGRGVFHVERDDALARQQVHRGEHVARARVVGQLELDVVRARAFAQPGKESHCDPHAPDPRPRTMEDVDGALTHLDAAGNARMVDVSAKDETSRWARARAVVRMSPEAAARVAAGDAPKGDVATVARIAAIQAAKRTDELIPLAHSLPLSHVEPTVTVDAAGGTVTLIAEARVAARTGVEMEAMVACSIGALAVYDMVKGIEPGVVIERVELLDKTGGKSDYHRT